jgi:hypothetical protein
MTMQRIPKSRTYPIVNITVASKTMEHVMRDSTERLSTTIPLHPTTRKSENINQFRDYN